MTHFVGSSGGSSSPVNFLSLSLSPSISFSSPSFSCLFFFPNVLFEPVQTFRAGYPDDYTIGEVNTKWKNKYGVWIIRNDEGIYALSTVCTHLGCTPNWLISSKKFKCPCHGSGFKMTGINFEGPAPRPLERYRIVLADSGEIIIDKTQKYQQEKGQWSDPEAFLKV